MAGCWRSAKGQHQRDEAPSVPLRAPLAGTSEQLHHVRQAGDDAFVGRRLTQASTPSPNSWTAPAIFPAMRGAENRTEPPSAHAVNGTRPRHRNIAGSPGQEANTSWCRRGAGCAFSQNNQTPVLCREVGPTVARIHGGSRPGPPCEHIQQWPGEQLAPVRVKCALGRFDLGTKGSTFYAFQITEPSLTQAGTVGIGCPDHSSADRRRDGGRPRCKTRSCGDCWPGRHGPGRRFLRRLRLEDR